MCNLLTYFNGIIPLLTNQQVQFRDINIDSEEISLGYVKDVPSLRCSVSLTPLVLLNSPDQKKTKKTPSERVVSVMWEEKHFNHISNYTLVSNTEMKSEVNLFIVLFSLSLTTEPAGFYITHFRNDE